MKFAAVTIVESVPGRFLTLHYVKKGECAWRFPGGKVDNFESPVQAASRELREEVGVTATELRFVCCMTAMLDGREWCCYFFEAVRWVGNPYIKEPTKFDAMRFFSMPKLYSLGSWNVADVLAWRQGIKPVGPGVISSPYRVNSIEARLLDELRCSQLSVEQVAARAGVTEDTAENVLRKLRTQLKLNNREALVQWWGKNRVVINFLTGRTA